MKRTTLILLILSFCFFQGVAPLDKANNSEADNNETIQQETTKRETTKRETKCVRKLNLKKGTLDGMRPTASMDEVKKKFPCFTGDTEEGSRYNCGGGVFFLKHDFYFYTHDDRIEVRKDFKGKVSIKLLGKSKAQVLKKLGTPTLEHKAYNYLLYKKKYGTLAVSFQDGECTKLFVSSKRPEDIKICH